MMIIHYLIRYTSRHWLKLFYSVEYFLIQWIIRVSVFVCVCVCCVFFFTCCCCVTIYNFAQIQIQIVFADFDSFNLRCNNVSMFLLFQFGLFYGCCEFKKFCTKRHLYTHTHNKFTFWFILVILFVVVRLIYFVCIHVRHSTKFKKIWTDDRFTNNKWKPK